MDGILPSHLLLNSLSFPCLSMPLWQNSCGVNHMEKPAATDYPIEELLRRRWSPRAFSDQPVESEKLLTLFEAARWAPSSFNEQPWSFIVASKQNKKDNALPLSCLMRKNN